MKRVLSILIVILSIACLFSCSLNNNSKWPSRDHANDTPINNSQVESESADQSKNARANSPYSSTDCINMQKEDLISAFRRAGFKNISDKELSDLTADDLDNKDIVATITINGNSDFAKDADFPSTADVVISYHSPMLIDAPIDSEAAKSIAADELIDLFENTGFLRIKTEEITDLDPDTVSEDYLNMVTIDGKSSFDKSSKFPLDAQVEIVTHRTYEKYTLKVVVDFVGNLIFSKYDVIIEVNGETATMPHGEDGVFEYRLTPNKYTITFASAESSSIKTTEEIDLTGDTEISYKIACYSDEITVETLYIENKSALKENEAMVPASSSNCKYKNYQDVEKWFKEAGFSNISTKILYDIFWGITPEGEVANVTVDGQTSFNRGDIFPKDVPVVITYHMKEEDDPGKTGESTSNETKPVENTSNEKGTTIKGTSRDTVEKTAKQFGLTKLFDEDWGQGLKNRSMQSSSGGLTMDITYSTSTMEVVMIDIVCFNGLSTEQEQKEFIKAIAAVACPPDDAESVTSWVNVNIGSEATTNINGITYDLHLGYMGNLCYTVGEPEWESWYSFD